MNTHIVRYILKTTSCEMNTTIWKKCKDNIIWSEYNHTKIGKNAMWNLLLMSIKYHVYFDADIFSDYMLITL